MTFLSFLFPSSSKEITVLTPPPNEINHGRDDVTLLTTYIYFTQVSPFLKSSHSRHVPRHPFIDFGLSFFGPKVDVEGRASKHKPSRSTHSYYKLYAFDTSSSSFMEEEIILSRNRNCIMEEK